MAVDWDAEVLGPLMSPDVFGEDVRPNYRPAAGAPFYIDGVFDRPYKGLVMEADGSPAIATRAPVIGVRLSQFPPGVAPLKGDKIYVDSVPQLYMVSDVQPDGKGHAKLELNITQ